MVSEKAGREFQKCPARPARRAPNSAGPGAGSGIKSRGTFGRPSLPPPALSAKALRRGTRKMSNHRIRGARRFALALTLLAFC
jgi:hypothetical protein